MSDSGPAAEKPCTVPSMFYKTVQRVPTHPALGKINSPNGIGWVMLSNINTQDIGQDHAF